uniref:Uncharacterized protein n=1 Tax=Anguilla anguilla TaxID=7936 RepID=A0A0E9SSN3_ANGAN
MSQTDLIPYSHLRNNSISITCWTACTTYRCKFSFKENQLSNAFV